MSPTIASDARQKMENWKISQNTADVICIGVYPIPCAEKAFISPSSLYDTSHMSLSAATMSVEAVDDAVDSCRFISLRPAAVAAAADSTVCC